MILILIWILSLTGLGNISFKDIFSWFFSFIIFLGAVWKEIKGRNYSSKEDKWKEEHQGEDERNVIL